MKSISAERMGFSTVAAASGKAKAAAEESWYNVTSRIWGMGLLGTGFGMITGIPAGMIWTAVHPRALIFYLSLAPWALLLVMAVFLIPMYAPLYIAKAGSPGLSPADIEAACRAVAEAQIKEREGLQRFRAEAFPMRDIGYEITLEGESGLVRAALNFRVPFPGDILASFQLCITNSPEEPDEFAFVPPSSEGDGDWVMFPQASIAPDGSILLGTPSVCDPYMEAKLEATGLYPFMSPAETVAAVAAKATQT